MTHQKQGVKYLESILYINEIFLQFFSRSVAPQASKSGTGISESEHHHFIEMKMLLYVETNLKIFLSRAQTCHYVNYDSVLLF